MLPSTSIDLPTTRTDGTVFWSRGNRPTQNLHRLTKETVSLHLKALYLLADRVVGAASFFFESMITRAVTQELLEVFHTGEIAYFVDETIEDFVEHGSRKAEKSPDSLTCYGDPTFVQRCGRDLNALDYIVRRQPTSLSDRIVLLWADDLNSLAPGTLGERLEIVEPDETRRVRLLGQLIQVGFIRGHQDFVWEFVQPRLAGLGVPSWFCRLARYRLAQMYSIATSEALGIALDTDAAKLQNTEINQHSRYDSGIFLSCLDTLGATDALRRIPPSDLVLLKASSELQVFREFYFALLDSVGGSRATIKTWLPLYRSMAVEFSGSTRTVEEFMDGFAELCRSLRKGLPSYQRPLDILLRLCDLTGHLTIEDFLVALGRASGGGVKYHRRRNSQPRASASSVVINAYTIKATIMGDIFSNISNSTIINRSLVERSFDKLSQAHDDETAAALVTIANEIAKANNTEAGEAFTAFNEELQKETPRRPVLASLWKGVVAALPALAQLTTVVEKVTKLFS